MSFQELTLIEPLLRALEAEGYERPTPIQQQAIPPVLQGKDLLGCAQTGTGKTAAFALPILQLLHGTPPPQQQKGPRPIRALILTPTRELALQIGESFTAYGRNLHLRNSVIFGGVGQQPQTDALRRGIDILVATPGRLLDLIQQGYVNLRDLSIFVLDEADRMLDMGFIHDVRKVIAQLPKQRQTLFFSATMPPEIATLADTILTNPAKVAVAPPATTAELVAQQVFFVERKDKKALLVHLMKSPEIRSALIFTRTKHGANKVAADLTKAGIRAEAIHGNKSQSARVAALSNFKNGSNKALVATDIAARGIDIDELSHVINFELPNVPETYVHRIGRTGRAGASGVAWSFCEAEELPYLKDIQKLTGIRVPVAENNPFAADLDAPTLAPARPRPQEKSAQRHQKPSAAPVHEREGSAERSANGRDGRNRNRNRRKNRNRQQDQTMPTPASGQQMRPEAPRQQASGAPRNPESAREQQRHSAAPHRRPENRPASAQQQQQRPPKSERPAAQAGPKLSKAEAANELRKRFSSILEVSSIEKQDFKRKSKSGFGETEKPAPQGNKGSFRDERRRRGSKR